ncbi:thiamine ABC transporter ATP-binding protein [Marinomonas sp. 42_23_T18]|nr:thiamine ABC transporter ATP-binding protein [Marinomonas sp. 42_23_T18]
MLNIDVRYQWFNQHGVDFEADYQAQLSPGLTTLLGASGEGKSTLLHLIGGFLQGSGCIQYLSQNLMTLAPYQRPVTTLFQSDNLFPQLSVWQNVGLGLATNLKLNPVQKRAVSWALERTQLTSMQAKKPEALSGGQAQRVAIARAIARAVVEQEEERKPILLLDEPFSALDPSLRAQMLMLVAELTQQLALTTLIVSHLPDEAKMVGGKLLLIEQGKVVLHDSVSILDQAENVPALTRYLNL